MRTLVLVLLLVFRAAVSISDAGDFEAALVDAINAGPSTKAEQNLSLRQAGGADNAPPSTPHAGDAAVVSHNAPPPPSNWHPQRSTAPRHGRLFIRGDLLHPGTPQSLSDPGTPTDDGTVSLTPGSLWVKGRMSRDGGAVGVPVDDKQRAHASHWLVNRSDASPLLPSPPFTRTRQHGFEHGLQDIDPVDDSAHPGDEPCVGPCDVVLGVDVPTRHILPGVAPLAELAAGSEGRGVASAEKESATIAYVATQKALAAQCAAGGKCGEGAAGGGVC